MLLTILWIYLAIGFVLALISLFLWWYNGNDISVGDLLCSPIFVLFWVCCLSFLAEQFSEVTNHRWFYKSILKGKRKE